VLRRFTASEVDNLFDLDNDPEVMRLLSGGKPTPRDVIENKTLPRLLDYYERSERFGFWAAIEKSTGAFLGWFAFHPPEGGGSDEVELGYRLKKSSWGKGYATEGSRALIRKGASPSSACGASRADDSGQHRIPAGDGESRPGVRVDLPRGLAGAHRREGAKRGRVRANQGRMGAAGRHKKLSANRGSLRLPRAES
jgi:RimJ/RimL family protein N-acetyltransferase